MPLSLVARAVLVAGAALVWSSAAPAAVVSIAQYTPSPGVNTLPNGNVLTVGGAVLSNYDGEGYVVGPKIGSAPATKYTLLEKDGGKFLINNVHNGNDKITFDFAKPIYAISFDFEIFPDGTGVTPDFTFKADGNTIFHLDGLVPGTSGPLPAGVTQLGVGYTFSPNSGSAQQLSKQFIGSFSGTFANGVSHLEFIDWPVTIGVANFQFGGAPGVPEPPSALILTLGLLCAAGCSVWLGRRRPLPVVVAGQRPPARNG